MLGVATCAFQAGVLAPLPWMILAGAGLYMAYTPFNAMLFDRLIAYSGRVATAGFLIYVADASGYAWVASPLLLARNFGGFHLDWLRFFTAERLRDQHRRRGADRHGRGLLQPRPRTSGRPGRRMSPAPFASVEVLEKFLENLAGSPSDEEGLGELEHLLQCADLLRLEAPYDAELQVAGLLHDIGWRLNPSDDHGRVGADAARGLVGERVADLIRLHVDAKRYLVTRDSGYRARLSPVSVATLARQGAEMTAAEAARSMPSLHRDALSGCGRRRSGQGPGARDIDAGDLAARSAFGRRGEACEAMNVDRRGVMVAGRGGGPVAQHRAGLRSMPTRAPARSPTSGTW